MSKLGIIGSKRIVAAQSRTALGEFVLHRQLDYLQRKAVKLAVDGAEAADKYHLCFRSNFPVGSGIVAANDRGEIRSFYGSNIENDSLPATICAERTAAVSAVRLGFVDFKVVALLCRNSPGSTPCGVCRQVLMRFGRDAVFLNVCDHERNVRRCTISDLLPAAAGPVLGIEDLSDENRMLAWRVNLLKQNSYVPYSKSPRAALLVASNSAGVVDIFPGVSDDNASYGASALAEAVAMRTARTAGYDRNVKLVATVADLGGVNPIEGECLQILREFGPDAPIMLVDDSNSVVFTSLQELFPDSFGPDALS